MNCNQCEKELVQENCLICSACRQAVYCSRQCQKLNWKIHKSKCKQLRPDGNKEHSCDDCNSLNLKMKNQKLVIQCCYKKEWNSFFEGISRKTLIPLQDLKVIVQERLSKSFIYFHIIWTILYFWPVFWCRSPRDEKAFGMFEYVIDVLRRPDALNR